MHVLPLDGKDVVQAVMGAGGVCRTPGGGDSLQAERPIEAAGAICKVEGSCIVDDS